MNIEFKKNGVYKVYKERRVFIKDEMDDDRREFNMSIDFFREWVIKNYKDIAIGRYRFLGRGYS